jgi:hypothetical protein
MSSENVKRPNFGKVVATDLLITDGQGNRPDGSQVTETTKSERPNSGRVLKEKE